MSTATTVAPQTHKFTGNVIVWDLVGERKYIFGAMRYGYLRLFVQADVYSSDTGLGEQRELVKGHVKKLKTAMNNGTYVPTPFSIGTRQVHRDSLEFSPDGKNVEFTVDELSKLALIDANHRFEALEQIRSEGGDKVRRAVDNLRIPYILYLDGDPREDFVLLQAGIQVNKSHMLSVRIANGIANDKDGPYYVLAKEVAELLNTAPESLFHNLIQMDSRGSKPLPVKLSSICTKSASELAFSLFGGAKVALKNEQDANWLAQCIDLAYGSLKRDKEGKKLLDKGQILEPEPLGSKAGSTLIIALGTALAARTWLLGQVDPDDESLDRLVECAVANLNLLRRGNSSSERKRMLYHGFCVDYFADLDSSNSDEEEPDNLIGFHEGIPIALIKLLSPSTFGVSKLPTAPKKKGRPKATVGVKPEITEADLIDDEVVGPDFQEEEPEFAEMDADGKEFVKALAESAPWDDEEDE